MAHGKKGGSAEAILLAALKVISRLGYAEASVAAIAGEAGVNNVTVYRLFEGKENLFNEVVTRFSVAHFDEDSLDTRLQRHTENKACLETMAADYFSVIFRNIDIIRIFIVESPHFAFVRSRAWYMPPAILAHCRRCFARLQSAADIEPGSRDRMAEMFVAHIVRRTMEYNKHDSIWHYDDTLAADFKKKIRPQIFLLTRLFAAPARNRQADRP